MGKTFNQWSKDDLRVEFNLRRIEQCDALEVWLHMIDEIPIELTELEKSFLEPLRKDADLYIEEWNEWELREQFISGVVRFANFNDPERFFSVFSERTLEAKVKSVRSDDDIELSGKVDWMIATGMGKPKTPFFFIHEYKQEGGGTKSNSGQLLATMLAAQTLNKDGKPIYGAYVLGRNWFFFVLEGRTYCMTEPYVSTKQRELWDILRMLKAQKLIVAERVSKQTN